ncbi:GapA-binding peptide SR1P [Paenibacillus xerothermodurans]|uniref:GapA-binding peptide SR1P n=1 Tax=Paenibacillus xerothermodurans TaxID=1977292 RepID=A0A2W1NVG5_PAEXE|nr:GapA-binding peptide SR1P [Paenibacillus xerothermodurans]PZE19682.1 GapA-binding peptide SR1P [Paenibacillus xerothermodurans]
MENLVGTVALGSILCKRCGTLIDTLDTDKVTIYYSDCRQEACVKEGTENKEREYEA